MTRHTIAVAFFAFSTGVLVMSVADIGMDRMGDKAAEQQPVQSKAVVADNWILTSPDVTCVTDPTGRIASCKMRPDTQAILSAIDRLSEREAADTAATLRAVRERK